MDYSKLKNNIFHILNVSLAVFFVSWQLITKFCSKVLVGGKAGDGLVSKCPLVPSSLMYDPLVITTFYLIILSLIIFLFLIASEKFYERVKELRFVFLVINMIFGFILFFEI